MSRDNIPVQDVRHKTFIRIFACAHMSQFDRAKKTSDLSFNALKWAKGVILDMQKSNSPELKEAAEKAKPIYNKAQKVLSDYNRKLLEWQKSGTKPTDIDVIAGELQTLTTEVKNILIKAQTKE